MANFGYVQLPCTKCGTTVWISPAAGIGVCPSCHTQATLPGGSPHMASGGANVAAAMSAGSGMPVLRTIGMILVVVVVGGGGVGYALLKDRFIAPKGKSTYGSLSLDSKRPDGDQMMTSVAKPAQKWKKDAYWWSTNFQAVRADGTVDVGKGASVEYISPSRVTQASKSMREDSIKKFVFTSSNVDHSQKWNATNQWKNVSPPALPQCTIKQLASALAAEGLTGDKTVRISFDPQFDWRQEQVWRVIGTDPKIDARFSMTTCEKLTGEPKGQAKVEGTSAGE